MVALLLGARGRLVGTAAPLLDARVAGRSGHRHASRLAALRRPRRKLRCSLLWQLIRHPGRAGRRFRVSSQMTTRRSSSPCRACSRKAGSAWSGPRVDGVEALARIRELQPDIAIVDVGHAEARRGRDHPPLSAEGIATRVLVYSGQRDPAVALEATEAGAAGFVLKGGELADLAHAVTVVAGGGTYLDPEIAAALSAPRSERPPLLTRREREVLRLLAEGFRNDEVAERLAISPLTVRTHVRHAMEKLGAGTRTEAVATALRLSLIR